MQSRTRRTRGWVTAVAGVGLAALWATGPARATEDLSMEELVSMLAEKQLGEVYEVEREHDGYEVKILDPEGAWLVLYVDPKTGEILHEERSGPGAEHAPDGPDDSDDDDDDDADDEADPGDESAEDEQD